MKTISVFLAFYAVFLFSSFQETELSYQGYFQENAAIGSQTGLPGSTALESLALDESRPSGENPRGEEVTTRSAQTGCLEAEILLISDWSGSIQGYEMLTKNALYSFVGGLELSPEGIRIGLITFDTEAFLDVPLTSHKSILYQSLNNLLDRRPDGYTNMTDALTLMIEEFSKHGRKNVRHIAIIISDGIPDDEQKVKLRANIARYDYRIVIYTVNVGGDKSNPEVLREISSGKGFYVDTNYKGLKQALKDLDFCI